MMFVRILETPAVRRTIVPGRLKNWLSQKMLFFDVLMSKKLAKRAITWLWYRMFCL